MYVGRIGPLRLRRTAGAVALLAVLLCAHARAHVPVLRGRLVELVAQSDMILIGTVRQVHPTGTRLVDTTLDVERVLAGRLAAPSVSFRGATHFALGSRQVVFLRRHGGELVGAQPSGTIFPAAPSDDQAYQQAIQAIGEALHAVGAQRAELLWKALLPALTAQAPPLRYHAALELTALAHAGHPPSEGARATLRNLTKGADVDPDLRPLLADLLAVQ